MAILKVIEILSNSSKSWEDAAGNAVKEANKTVKNIVSVNVNNFSLTVKNGKVDEYRVNAKITFAVGKYIQPYRKQSVCFYRPIV